MTFSDRVAAATDWLEAGRSGSAAPPQYGPEWVAWSNGWNLRLTGEIEAGKILVSADPQVVERTARKAHTCDHCKGEIARGSRYWEYLGEVAAYQSGYRYHDPVCAIAQIGTMMDARA